MSGPVFLFQIFIIAPLPLSRDIKLYHVRRICWWMVQCQWWPSLLIQRKIQNWLDLQVINLPPPLPPPQGLIKIFFYPSTDNSKNHKFSRCQSRDKKNWVGFTTTYAIRAYHHWREFESWSRRGVHYVIKSVTCDRSGFLYQ
jgi:hypothetical protein